MLWGVVKRAETKSQLDERRKEIKVSKVYAWSELPLLLNLQQVADALGYGRTKAWELIHIGMIRAVHVGHTLDPCVDRAGPRYGPVGRRHRPGWRTSEKPSSVQMLQRRRGAA